MAQEENENPLMDFIVPVLGIACLIALAIQTWFFIDWLMGGTEGWMKYLTLCFFDVFGGIWIAMKLFHTPPTHATYQMVRAGILIDFLLSASTTMAWCFIFITRTPLTPDSIANGVSVCRWVVAFAVIFNSFLTIFYAAATAEYQTQKGKSKKKRWATERVISASSTSTRRPTSTRVRVAQTATVRHPARQLPPARRKQIPASVQKEEPDTEELEVDDSEMEVSEDEEEEAEVEPAPLPQRLMEAGRALLPSGNRKQLRRRKRK